jgi:hypothetical protein
MQQISHKILNQKLLNNLNHPAQMSSKNLKPKRKRKLKKQSRLLRKKIAKVKIQKRRKIGTN